MLKVGSCLVLKMLWIEIGRSISGVASVDVVVEVDGSVVVGRVVVARWVWMW